jgi:hypothetical protein
MVGNERSIHDVREASLEAAHGLLGTAASRSPTCEILASLWVVSSLGECDAMQRGIELTVAHPAQPVANAIGRPDRQRGRAVVSCEGILRMKALYAC